MRIALAQINPTVGAIDTNVAMIRQDIERARDRGADLVVFPELAITGYPPKDLLLKPAFVDACVDAINVLAEECVDIAAIIGFPSPSDDMKKGRALYNTAAFCAEGNVIHRHIKSLLPTYDVFDEHRYFEPGPEVDLAEYRGLHLGISVCEDLWNDEQVFSRTLYHDNPIEELARMGADLFINASASPFVNRKHVFRMNLFRHTARRFNLPLIYCNTVGGNDELVFDGNSCAVSAEGEIIAHAKAFEPDLLFVDMPELEVEGVDRTKKPALHGELNRIEPLPDEEESVYRALVLGLRDYCRKCGFKSVVLGLSGGIDSAVSAAIAVAALGKENVRGVAMPSRYSSDHSVTDARVLAENLDIQFDIVPIKEAHEALDGMLAPIFEGTQPNTAEENIQARIRGIILMAISNKFGSMLVSTGNKSEMAVGYCTLYGDMAGGLAVLSDVPKTLVYRLAEWINEADASPLRQFYGKGVIPLNTIEKPPSAELRPDQKDSDSLPDYDDLDRIIELYVEWEHSVAHIVRETHLEPELVQRVVKMIDRNEYKRKQAAPGLKITGRAFGFGRRMPIAQQFDSSKSIAQFEAPAEA